MMGRVIRWDWVRSAVLTLAMAASPLLASCTLIQDLDVQQCTKDKDCAKYGADYKEYVCQSDVCVALTCTKDDDCSSHGGTLSNYVCGDNQRCAPPECTDKSMCTAKYGATA